MEPLCRFRATPFATTLAPPNHRGLVLRRGLAPAPRGWRDDSPLDDGSGGVANVKNKNNKKNKLKKLKVGSKGKGSAEDATLKKIDLGQGKSVLLYTPNDVAELDVAADRINYETLESFRDELYGAGDVVWPASTALARLVAHCPSLVRGKRVLEVGAGLGLVGNVAAQAGAAEVLMVDYDPEVLELAAKSAAANQASHSTPVKTLHEPINSLQFRTYESARRHPVGECRHPYSSAVLDWTDVATWPAGRFDVVVAADVLYDAAAAPRLAEVTSRVMTAGGDGSARAMGIFSDPGNRSHRGDFADRAAALGLETVEADFPGHPDMRLVQVTRVELSKV